ncbi:Dehydrogenase [Nesidiocoris tenuis]|uniref:Dehydrogenase n=1 Tax=Nesidiocoris tenuis TaxID=355587 RepID=A0ABN7AH84_9HEMI|nr:Dehydrogenase [Nesidiocoris tenuis]
MPAKPDPKLQPKPAGSKTPPTANADRFNLNELKTDVTPEIEKAIASSRTSQLSRLVAFVTGGADGLGKEIVTALAKEGTKVAILDKDPNKGHDLSVELSKNFGRGSVMHFSCDLNDSKSMDTAMKLARTQLGRFDILVNCASCWGDNSETYEKSISLNFKAVVKGSLLAIEYMSATKGGEGGLVANIVDNTAIKPSPLTPVYSATKAAVLKFTTDMGLPQMFNLTKIGFISIMASGITGTQRFDDPEKKIIIPRKELVEPFKENLKTNGAKQSPQHVAEKLISVIKKGEKSGVFLIENGDDFKKLESSNNLK